SAIACARCQPSLRKLGGWKSLSRSRLSSCPLMATGAETPTSTCVTVVTVTLGQAVNAIDEATARARAPRHVGAPPGARESSMRARYQSRARGVHLRAALTRAPRFTYARPGRRREHMPNNEGRANKVASFLRGIPQKQGNLEAYYG